MLLSLQIIDLRVYCRFTRTIDCVFVWFRKSENDRIVDRRRSFTRSTIRKTVIYPLTATPEILKIDTRMLVHVIA